MNMLVQAIFYAYIFASGFLNECSTLSTDVRLVGGMTEYEGRLEVYYLGRWGTVCDDDLNDKLSVVVCRSLGLPWNASKAYGGAAYGQGSGSIWLDNVNCMGSETGIKECSHNPWGSHDCNHGEDVSISCLPFTDIAVRLVGGVTENEGRLEVNRLGKWGTVCDDNLNDKLSVVVCRSLGLPSTTSEAYGGAVYGQRSGPIWLDDVKCKGSETSIEKCSHRPWGSHNCNHGDDVSINCMPNDTDVRLVGGATEYEGRLEVYKLGRWGTVCDDNLNDSLSVVVCRSLGLPWNASKAYGGAVYGRGSGPIWLDNVKCMGSETSVQECSHNSWGSHNCYHGKDVSISCLPFTDIAVRLVGGVTENEGRLEVNRLGRWGTVCDDNLNDKLSVVVCRSLGLPSTTSEAYGGAVYGQGSGPIWLDDVKCKGSETSIEKCSHRPWGSHNCNHGDDVSINCMPNDTDVRLVGGATEYEGRLEVYKLGRWGTVCDDNLNDSLSVVVCRSLGLPWTTSEAYGGAVYGQGSGPIWLDDVKCKGSETSIEKCSHRPWGSHNCNHGDDVSINCMPNDTDVRLVGGATEYEGRLEVYKLGRWGTVCDDNLNDSLSVVVCRSLGLPWNTSKAYGGAAYGPGSGPIWLDNVNCMGSETSVQECSHNSWGSHNCYHWKDVSISCLPFTDIAVRLVGGVTENEGRLEVNRLGRWGTVCDDNLNDKLSVVVCRSLGLPSTTSEAYGGAVYGQGSGPIWLDDVKCKGSETSIEKCSHRPWGSHNCNHGDDVSINCMPNDTDVRLVGGATEYEGRLEVYKLGRWGTVCDDNLNDSLSVVVCRSLGLPWNTSKAYGGAAYGPGSGPIWLDNVNCMGSETSVQECSHNSWGSHNCYHWKDVSISCLPFTDIAVRLVGGATKNEGRLEVNRLDRWGTVCDTKLNKNLSVVVCRSLGLPWATSEAYGGAVYGQGSGPIWLDDVNCKGSETSIEKCSHRPWGSHNCNHGDDVSINCLPNDTDVRLVGGVTEYEGRLEVYKLGRWGTVCDDNLNETLSVVVCRSLGLPWNTSKAYGGAKYGGGSGPIWLDNVKCIGSETSIQECSHNSWGSHNCNHWEDVSISCLPFTDIAVRLVGGASENEGRLEVNRLGRWGTVCDTRFNNNLSVVVCRSLGLPWTTSAAYGGAVYGQGSGPIWLDDVNCKGSETSIEKCSHRPWGSHNCNHWDDVSINCFPNDTAVRLVGGATEHEGRLEVYKFGRWGTVCDDSLNNNLSVVVCRSLGLPWTTSEAYGSAVYGQGSGTIWLDDVNCKGSETSIEKCSHRPWGSHNCNHRDDVSINCLPSSESNNVRLVGGATEYEGRLEIYQLGRWGTVCDDYLNDTLSFVVCRSLGLPWNTSKAYGGAAYGRGSGPIWLDSVKCMGSETSVKECSHNSWGSHDCNHGEDVSISCLPFTDIAVRLVGGASENEGRLEVNRLGRWGTVCDTRFNNNLSVVVCRSLGLPWTTSAAYGGAVYGQGSGPIWLDDVNCKGSETSIEKCSHRPWGSHNCNHWDDVSINCFPNDTAVRLVGGATEHEGRLEVYKFGRWGTVCDDSLNNNLSVVVCRSLGLPWTTSEAYGSAVYGQGSGTIWLDDVNCKGSETSIEKCSHRPWGSHNCNHRDDVSINCLPSSESNNVRLVGGATEYEGRLEIYQLGRWGTVCDDYLNDTLSFVVCRSLGLPWNTSKAYGGAAYGRGSGPIWLDSVKCMGSETSVKECSHNSWGSHDCNHGEDVSISCLPFTDIDVRLVGGATKTEGRLEVNRLGRWGTVCGDNLNDKLPVVVCRSMGLSWTTSEAYGSAVYGQGSGPIWLDDVNCKGSETSIEKCSHRPWGSHNCNHGDDVSIICLPSDVAVRLVGGATEFEGRLEVYKFGRWGTVCDDDLDDKLSVVVCRSLGLPWITAKAYGGALYGQGSGPIWLDNVRCVGNETSIEKCRYRQWGSHNCGHGEDVSIICLQSNDTAVRLVGGATKYEGRLEVYRLGKWGTVCDDGLNDTLSVVVCRSLGFPWNTSKAYGGAAYGQGSGPIWFDTVKCSGSETSIEQCSHSGSGSHYCNHGEDVSVSCLPSSDVAVRIVGGATEYQGRLELNRLGIWGTVCDDGLNDTLSVVVCRSLGLPWTTSEAYGGAVYGQGSGPIWLDDVNCKGSETSIEKCSHRPWGSHNCNHGDDVSINCLPNDTIVRLVGGTNEYEGRLEIYKSGKWGTVCDDGLNDTLSVVVCRSLGFPWKTSKAFGGATYGQGSGPVWLDNVKCMGTETSIEECSHNSWGSHDCSHGEDVSISCSLSNEKTMCNIETAMDILWSTTIAGTTIKKPCFGNQIGTATRLCDSEGKWRNPNLVNCTDKVFHEASQKLTALRDNGVNNTEEVEKTVNSTLQTMKNLTATTTEMSAGDIQSSLDIIEAVVDVLSLSGATIEKKIFFEVVDNVLSKNNSDSWTAVNTETPKDASMILKNMDRLSEEVLKKNDTKFNFSGTNFELSINEFKVNEEGIKFPTMDDYSNDTGEPATFLALPKQTSKTNTEMNYVAAIYKTMSEIFPTNTNLKGKGNINIRTEEKKTVVEYVNSDILSLTTQIDLGILIPPLNLTFYHKKKNHREQLYPVCVSWNFYTKMWSEKGCQMFSTSRKSTSCLCNHLTNFAILMRPYIPETKDESSLKTLSFIGVVLSIAFIVLTFTIYILTWKKTKNDQNTMLLNLCVSLVLSYIVFITAVEKTDNEILCSAVTAIIHYLFLVTFFSMLGIGVYYFMSITVTYYAMYVANNFKSRSRVHWFLLGAWGIPLVFSASTLGGFWKKEYHLKHYCWLSVESGSLLLFIVPVCCTIVLNIVVIISLVRVLLASSLMMKSSLKKKAASGLRSLGTLLPVLGVTWLFGILAVNKYADFFQYLFIIANSLQGFFIFVSQVVLNKKLMLSLRTQYPFLGALTSFAETNKKDTTVFRSHSTASDTLMKQYKKKGFFSKCRRLNKRKQEGVNKLKTFDSFSTERTTDNL
nr:deleted in malignant brain tumors 1 protein-like isoform X6 [Crassostrea gigas]